jgi:hypothetical protein
VGRGRRERERRQGVRISLAFFQGGWSGSADATDRCSDCLGGWKEGRMDGWMDGGGETTKEVDVEQRHVCAVAACVSGVVVVVLFHRSPRGGEKGEEWIGVGGDGGAEAGGEEGEAWCQCCHSTLFRFVYIHIKRNGGNEGRKPQTT